jgi:hypothetical protein
MFPLNGHNTAHHPNCRYWPDDGVSGEATALLGPDEPASGATTRAEAAAGLALPSRSARSLDWALRIAVSGPRPFYRAALVSLALTSTLAMAIAAFTRPPGPLPVTQRHLVAHALVALGASTALGLASLAAGDRYRPPAWLDRVVPQLVRAAIWLALAAWFPFLLVVVYYRAKATFPPPVRYVYFPYDDKHWETAGYLLGVLAPMLWMALAGRVLTVARSRPLTWRAWFAGLFPRFAPVAPTLVDLPLVDLPRVTRAPVDPSPVGRRWDGARRRLAAVAGLATAFGLAWYFLGPPWHISQTTAPISKQEDVVLIGLQAVAEGHLPYVGVASVQYGPGTQLAAYLLMRHVTAMSVVGFREAWALFALAGAFVLFAVFFLAFDYARGLAASLLSVLVYPTLRQIAFAPGGSFNGYWGWANPLRYVGVIALVLLLPAVVRRCPSWHGGNGGGQARRTGAGRRALVLSGHTRVNARVHRVDEPGPCDHRRPHRLRRWCPRRIPRSRLLRGRPEPSAGLVRRVQQHRDRARTACLHGRLPHQGGAADTGALHDVPPGTRGPVLPAAIQERPPGDPAFSPLSLLHPAAPGLARPAEVPGRTA